MTYEEIMAKLSAEEQEVFRGEIHKRNEENKSLRERLKTQSPKAVAAYEALRARFGVEEIDETFLDQLQQKTAEGLTAAEQVKALKASLEKESMARKEAEKRLSSASIAQRERERDGRILDAVGKAGVRPEASSKACKLIAMESTFDDVTGAYLYNGKSLSEYMDDFRRENQYMIANPIGGGAGDSRASTSGGGSSDADFISEDDYLKLTPTEQRSKEVRARVAKSMDKWKK